MCGRTVRAGGSGGREDKGLVDGRRKKGKKTGQEEERTDPVLAEQMPHLLGLMKRGQLGNG